MIHRRCTGEDDAPREGFLFIEDDASGGKGPGGDDGVLHRRSIPAGAIISAELEEAGGDNEQAHSGSRGSTAAGEFTENMPPRNMVRGGGKRGVLYNTFARSE